ncbi:hypothetical protein ACIREO_23515 [Streptomyces sp. NPDC102441]|uniref:hypothetical protein n=1 Tax=Streptomyces sp. NPDC102441 TaxID=3366176 RepID=UPI00382B4DBF
MQTESRLPETEALEFLKLLEGAPFLAPYTGQVIDWLIRASSPPPEEPDTPSAARAVAALRRYGDGHDLGAEEIAQRIRDVAHAMTLAQADHYAADPGTPSAYSTGRTVQGRDLRQLCVAVGRDRSLAGPGRTVVIVDRANDPSVFRPLNAVGPARSRPSRKDAESAEALGREVLAVLAPHVRLANRQTFEGSGVLVEARRDAVEVAWWSPDMTAEGGLDLPDPWVAGGVRSLCATLLRGDGRAISQNDRALLVSR